MLAAVHIAGSCSLSGTWCGVAAEEERRPSWMWWRDAAEEAAALAYGVRRWRPSPAS
jgi:hypothetical protein